MLDVSRQSPPFVYFGLRCSWWGTSPRPLPCLPTATTWVALTAHPELGIPTARILVCPHCSGGLWRVSSQAWFDHLRVDVDSRTRMEILGEQNHPCRVVVT